MIVHLYIPPKTDNKQKYLDTLTDSRLMLAESELDTLREYEMVKTTRTREEKNEHLINRVTQRDCISKSTHIKLLW